MKNNHSNVDIMIGLGKASISEQSGKFRKLPTQNVI